MTIDELCALFGLSRHTIYSYTKRGIIPPGHAGRGFRWTSAHVEAIRAYLAIKHNNVNPAEVVAFCKEEGIGLPEYVRRREDSIRTFGLGIA